GLWQDDINSNLAAIAVADKMHMHTMHHRMHSMDFLNYAYLQTGDDQNAKAQADHLMAFHRQDVEGDYRDYYDGMIADFTARYAIERRQWKEALALQPVSGATPGNQAIAWWAHAVAAGHLRDAAAGQEALKNYEDRLEALKKTARGYLAAGLKDE